MFTQTHVVIGAGAIGTLVARQLAEAGHDVRVVTRSGGGPDHPRAERIKADASDASVLRDIATGAVAVYNCANPPGYHLWAKAWPPLAASILGAAEHAGAILATVGNLYPYGLVDGPMTEDLPLRPVDHKGELRAQMWRDALAAHEAGRIRAVEVRASDWAGAAREGMSHVGRAAGMLLAGKRVRVIGSPDQPHSWTYPGDVARLLVVAAADPSAYGRPWHVPSNPPRTQRQVVADMAEIAGLPEPKVSGIGSRTMRMAAPFVPLLREVVPLMYQFERPFVLDDSAARAHFGMQPTPWRQVLTETIEDARAKQAAKAARR